jgi:O-antigen ligase
MAPQSEPRRIQCLTWRWFIPGLTIATIVLFTLIQYFFSLPESHEFTPVGTGFSPFEDNHSLGSITVALLALLLMHPQLLSVNRILRAICVIFLIAVIANSFSRATWLGGVIVVFVAISTKLSRKWLFTSVCVGLMFVMGFNVYALRDQWWKNPHVGKIIRLVRIEKLSEKSPGRISLYQRAWEMIKERPLTGHGIGSFYMKSAKYSPANDPQKYRPDFAHNFLFQFTAELGIPAALILLALFASALFAGFVNIQIISQAAYVAAFSCYLITQLTANSLNIYLTNQVFFWWLVAMIIVVPANPPDRF